MAYGSQDTRGDGSNGAVGWLIGAENHGLEYMFVMMNAARFSVGVQGIGVAERAYQHALKYAQERRQGADATTKGVGSVAIIQHPDVRRMLLTMKSGVEAMRALAVVTAVATDAAQRERDPALRQRAQSRLALLIPVVKGWCTESAVLLASLGIQVQGGMGYIEETGAAQYLRDARILPIYEGTTGIQALDLVGRKLLRDGGQAARQLLAEMRQTLDELNAAGSPELKTTSALLRGGIDALDRAVQFVVNTGATDLKRALAGAAPLLRLFGIVCGGWQMARAALIATRQLTAGRGESGFYRTKLLTGQFYGANVLSEADSLAYAVTNGAGPILDFTDEQF
jgi:acyl-CoA dehydrogenase